VICVPQVAQAHNALRDALSNLPMDGDPSQLAMFIAKVCDPSQLAMFIAKV
jgi:hypothetical protein